MIRRKKTFQTYREAEKLGPYDEQPMLPDDIDPQVHMSRNDRIQPFYLICEKDTTIAILSGKGHIRFQQSSVNYFPYDFGDYVYVPAGTPHRMEPDTESTVYRYKANNPGLEGVAWYCDNCQAEIHRVVWDCEKLIPQQGYLDACETFNKNVSTRTCERCNNIYDKIDLTDFRWAEIATELQAE